MPTSPSLRRGTILLKSGYTDDSVFITVADTGCGISPEVMGSIYEPFLTTKSTGSGLGLLIVRRIVKEHGGSITLASQPGQNHHHGLPAARGTHHQAPAILHSLMKMPVLLIVDDEKPTRDALRMGFQDDYEVYTAANLPRLPHFCRKNLRTWF
ncbi:MAG: ATP-binding protein [Akkermansia sp.]